MLGRPSPVRSRGLPRCVRTRTANGSHPRQARGRAPEHPRLLAAEDGAREHVGRAGLSGVEPLPVLAVAVVVERRVPVTGVREDRLAGGGRVGAGGPGWGRGGRRRGGVGGGDGGAFPTRPARGLRKVSGGRGG